MNLKYKSESFCYKINKANLKSYIFYTKSLPCVGGKKKNWVGISFFSWHDLILSSIKKGIKILKNEIWN